MFSSSCPEDFEISLRTASLSCELYWLHTFTVQKLNVRLLSKLKCNFNFEIGSRVHIREHGYTRCTFRGLKMSEMGSPISLSACRKRFISDSHNLVTLQYKFVKYLQLFQGDIGITAFCILQTGRSSLSIFSLHVPWSCQANS